MSLYNAVFGVNPMAGLLLAVLELHTRQIPRFRDCFLSTGKEPEIIICTRTGGGNRAWYDKPNEENPGPYNEDLRKHPLYVKDEDDSFDNTYALFYFKIPNPELATRLVETALELEIDNRLPAERFQEMLEKLKNGKE